MKALILSAGLGERLRPITQDIPKVMVPINGKPCLQYVIENLTKQGIKDFAINTHYLPKIIEDYFENGKKFGVNIRYSFEPEILGTSGALNNFRDFFRDTFLVAYGDIIADFDLNHILDVHRKNKAEATIVLDSKRNMENKGAVLVCNERVISFIEKPGRHIDGAYINSGFYLLEPSVFDIIHEGFSDFGKNILPKLVIQDRLFWDEHKGYIFDIGTFDGLKKAEEFLRTRII